MDVWIELAVIAAVLGWAGMARAIAVRERHFASKMLSRYAASRGFHFVPANAALRGASPEVRGALNEIRFRLDLFRLGESIRTRIRAETGRGPGAELSIARRGAFRWKEAAPPRPPIRLDDEAFDDAFVIVDALADDLERLRAMRGELLALAPRDGVWLRHDGARVTLTWSGIEWDPRVLDTAYRAVVAIAGWHRPPLPYR